MVQLNERPPVQSADLQSLSENSYRLMYRGTIYEMPGQSAVDSNLETVQQLVGKRLMYRGTHYEIVPAQAIAEEQSEAIGKLCYRGVTYWSNSKPSQKRFDYVVV